MELIVHRKAEGLLDVAREALEERESANGLILGVTLRLAEAPTEGAYLATVTDTDALVLAAVMTPPHNMLLFSPVTSPPLDATRLLCKHILSSDVAVRGVLGAVDLASQFSVEWTHLTSAIAAKGMAQTIYELREVRTGAATADGHFRLAGPDDVDVLTGWHGEPLRGSLQDLVRAGRMGLWELDEPVSCAAQARRTTHGGAINLVLTPPHLRRCGYATACVSSLCQRLLDSGWQFCFLHADRANATSNSIYRKIGFKPVADFQEHKFETLPSQVVEATS